MMVHAGLEASPRVPDWCMVMQADPTRGTGAHRKTFTAMIEGGAFASRRWKSGMTDLEASMQASEIFTERRRRMAFLLYVSRRVVGDEHDP